MDAPRLELLSRELAAICEPHELFLQPLHDGQLLLVLRREPAPPPGGGTGGGCYSGSGLRLRLAAESDLTRKLDKLGISTELKVGITELDDRFVIAAEDAERAQRFLQSASNALLALSPFEECELNEKECRLLKRLDDDAHIRAALEGLMELIEMDRVLDVQNS